MIISETLKTILRQEPFIQSEIIYSKHNVCRQTIVHATASGNIRVGKQRDGRIHTLYTLIPSHT